MTTTVKKPAAQRKAPAPTAKKDPATPTVRSSLADKIWRARKSPWKSAGVMATFAAVAIPVIEWAATGTVTLNGALVAPFAAAPITALADPRSRARARIDLKNAGTSAQMRGRWNRWVNSEEGKPLEYPATFTRRAFLGQQRVRPRIISVEKKPLRITVESPTFLTKKQWDGVADSLGRNLRQHPAKVRLDKEKHRAVLTFPLDTGDVLPLIPSWSSHVPDELPDLKAVPVARDVDGNPVTMRIWGMPWLLSGATEGGKSSGIWSVVEQIAPGVKSGIVELYGIDPKGGVELSFGRSMFTEFAGDDDSKDTGDEIIRILELTVATMKSRLSRVRGETRLHTPVVGAPLIVLIFDEFLTLEAAIPDPKQRRRAYSALTILLSQGRAAAVTVIAAAQLSQKNGGVAIRDLFTGRLCLRVTDEIQARMILGDGEYCEEGGASMIRGDQQGTGFMRLDGQKLATMFRFPWIPDERVKEIARGYPTPNRGGGSAPQLGPVLPLEPLTPEEEAAVAAIVAAAEEEEEAKQERDREKRSPTQVAIEKLLDDDWLDAGEIAKEVASQLGKCSRNYVTKLSAKRPYGAKKLAIHRSKEQLDGPEPDGLELGLLSEAPAPRTGRRPAGDERDERANNAPGGQAGPGLDTEKRPTTNVTSIRDCGALARDEVSVSDPTHAHKPRQFGSLPDDPFEPETPVTVAPLEWDSGTSLDFLDSSTDWFDDPTRSAS